MRALAEEEARAAFRALVLARLAEGGRPSTERGVPYEVWAQGCAAHAGLEPEAASTRPSSSPTRRYPSGPGGEPTSAPRSPLTPVRSGNDDQPPSPPRVVRGRRPRPDPRGRGLRTPETAAPRGSPAPGSISVTAAPTGTAGGRRIG